MTNPTSNFGWQMPTSTDLVTDLPADFEVFGQAVDTSLADLKGGTTGQILAKNSNANMDFVWTTAAPGDITAVNVTSPITGGGTSGDVTIGISSSAVVPSQTGNSGKYLTTDGTTSSWGTISAGGMTLIATATPSAASTFSFTSIPTTTYKHLMIVANELVWSATGNAVKMRFATGSYYSSRVITGTGSTFNADAGGRGDTYFGQSQNEGCPIVKGYTSGGTFGDISSKSIIWIYDMQNTSQDRLVEWRSFGNALATVGMGAYENSAALDTIEFATTAGTVTGTVKLYGVN
jgi:hypothetical protein